jgi:hypothetical protein
MKVLDQFKEKMVHSPRLKPILSNLVST